MRGYFADGFEKLSPAMSSKGVSVRVGYPMPERASRYAAGPTFSEVELNISVAVDANSASRAPSFLTVAEIVSRAVHNWIPPMECGYGKVALAQKTPWSFSASTSAEKISIKFNVQSVLQ